MNRRSMFILSAVAALALSQPARAADPTIDGTWGLDIAASKSTDPMPKSTTRTYVITGEQEKLTGTIVTADGKRSQSALPPPSTARITLSKVQASTRLPSPRSTR